MANGSRPAWSAEAEDHGPRLYPLNPRRFCHELGPFSRSRFAVAVNAAKGDIEAIADKMEDELDRLLRTSLVGA
jgi:hypothetical protein